MLSDNEVRLHLSGHLHLQHYMEEDDVAEVVTGSLVMAPCRYGVVDLYEDGSITYHTETVNVEKWARENSYKNPDLADFFHYSENFLHQISYEHAVSDLERQNRKGTLHLSGDEIETMSQSTPSSAFTITAERCMRLQTRSRMILRPGCGINTSTPANSAIFSGGFWRRGQGLWKAVSGLDPCQANSAENRNRSGIYDERKITADYAVLY